jgi:tetratricopeptide (TPR) repeat protein
MMNKSSSQKHIDPAKKAYYEAQRYLKGIDGYPKDEKKAVDLFKLAASHYLPEAQSDLGYCYENGLGGLSVDSKKALEYYKMAAEQNIPEAMFAIGNYYEQGSGGLKADRNKAIEYFEKAASPPHNLIEAMNGLGGIYLSSVDTTKAMNYYKRAAILTLDNQKRSINSDDKDSKQESVASLAQRVRKLETDIENTIVSLNNLVSLVSGGLYQDDNDQERYRLVERYQDLIQQKYLLEEKLSRRSTSSSDKSTLTAAAATTTPTTTTIARLKYIS